VERLSREIDLPPTLSIAGNQDDNQNPKWLFVFNSAILRMNPVRSENHLEILTTRRSRPFQRAVGQIHSQVGFLFLFRNFLMQTRDTGLQGKRLEI
jgi:hypothetical protein